MCNYVLRGKAIWIRNKMSFFQIFCRKNMFRLCIYLLYAMEELHNFFLVFSMYKTYLNLKKGILKLSLQAQIKKLKMRPSLIFSYSDQLPFFSKRRNTSPSKLIPLASQRISSRLDQFLKSYSVLKGVPILLSGTV